MSVYGCAYDAAADSYWWNSALGLVSETSASMVPTGRTWDGSAMFPSFGAIGGLDLYEDARSPTGAAFVVLSQGAPDQIGVYEADAGSAANNVNTTGPLTCGTPPPPVWCELETIYDGKAVQIYVVYFNLTVHQDDVTITG